MNCFLVITEDISQEQINREYPTNYKVKDGIWAVAAGRLTTSNMVSDKFEFQPEKNNGIVVKVADYFGCYNPALWSSLSTWMNTDG